MNMIQKNMNMIQKKAQEKWKDQEKRQRERGQELKCRKIQKQKKTDEDLCEEMNLNWIEHSVKT